MKSFNVDWVGVLDFAGVWGELSLGQRACLLELGPHQAVDANSFGADLGELISRGFLEVFKDGQRVRPTKAFRPLIKVMRAMNRVEPFDPTDPSASEDYLREILTGEEREALFGQGHRLAQNVGGVANSVAFLESFLEADDPAQWERERIGSAFFGRTPKEEHLLQEPRAASDLRKLLRVLMDQPRPIPFIELRGAVGRLSRRRLADAIYAGLRYALAFAGFDADGRPALGLAPRLAHRLHRPTAERPQPVVPEVSGCVGRAFEDVERLAVFCSEPRRMKSGGRELFAKVATELAGLLDPLPAWLDAGIDDEARIDWAVNGALSHELVQVTGTDGRTLRLELTAEGREWLARPTAERLRELAEPQRLATSEEEAPWRLETRNGLTSDLAAAFAFLEGPVRLSEFLRYHAESANPLSLEGSAYLGWYDGRPTSEDELEALWAATLQSLLSMTLFPLNGVRFGFVGGEATIELTDMGRYLLRLTDEFPAPEEEVRARLVVQPDFEIVFLGPSLALEATCTRFAERIGSGLGALFRITRASVQAAVHAGLSPDEILAELAESSETPVPENVAHEVRAWGGRAVRLAWEPVQLLRCPDEETAARVLAASKGKLELVSPTVLVLSNPKQRTALTNACRKAGVFLELPEEEAAPRRKRRSTRRWRW